MATQASLLLLLWGTLTSGLALISDIALVAAHQAFPKGGAPPWLSGRVLMAAMATGVLFPLCLQRHMRQVGWGRVAGGEACNQIPIITAGCQNVTSLRSWRLLPLLAWPWCWA